MNVEQLREFHKKTVEIQGVVTSHGYEAPKWALKLAVDYLARVAGMMLQREITPRMVDPGAIIDTNLSIAHDTLMKYRKAKDES